MSQWFVLFSLTKLFKSIVRTPFVTNVTMEVQHYFWVGEGHLLSFELWSLQKLKRYENFFTTASTNKVVTIIQLQRESLLYLGSGFGFSFSLISSNVNKRIVLCSCEFYTSRDLGTKTRNGHTYVNRWVNYKNCQHFNDELISASK